MSHDAGLDFSKCVIRFGRHDERQQFGRWFDGFDGDRSVHHRGAGCVRNIKQLDSRRSLQSLAKNVCVDPEHLKVLHAYFDKWKIHTPTACCFTVKFVDAVASMLIIVG
jgi:hypothetical protein